MPLNQENIVGVYLNNAATTWPKPSCVPAAVSEFLMRGGANLGRGTSSTRDLATLNTVMDCRLALTHLFEGHVNEDPRLVTFCTNITEALNIVLKGILRPGMSVISSSMEHNSVVRPLRALERSGVSVTFLDCDSEGTLSPEALDNALSLPGAHCDLVVLSHASNVCGTIQPLAELAKICRDRGVPLVVDSAQTAGILPISLSELDLAALCFTGHKGLMGPQGVGGIVWRPDFAERVTPFIEGGTGSFSHVETQPEDLPDKFEAGTPNLPGISGLREALSWLDETGVESVEAHERELGERLLAELREVEKAAPRFQLVLYGKPTMEGRLPVFGLNFKGPNGQLLDNGLLAGRLSTLGFETRPGLHCAPLAHRTLGSFPQGCLRVSPGYFNTFEEISLFREALIECLNGRL